MANATTLSGSALSSAASPDPDMCRISGYLINASAQPLKGWSFVLRYCYSPLGIAPGTVVLQERIAVKADEDGYVEFDLLRGAKVTAEMPNLLTLVNVDVLTVPDSASSDLLAFLYPFVESIDWEDDSALFIDVDERFTLSLVATLSNGETTTIPSSAVTVTSSNEAVVKKREGFTYFGVSAGSATLTVDAVDVSKLGINQTREETNLIFFEVPDPTLPATSLSVTVS